MMSLLKLLAEVFTQVDGKIESSVVDDAMRSAVRELIENGDRVEPDRAFKLLLAFQVDADAERKLMRKRLNVVELRLFIVFVVAAAALVASLTGWALPL